MLPRLAAFLFPVFLLCSPSFVQTSTAQLQPAETLSVPWSPNQPRSSLNVNATGTKSESSSSDARIGLLGGLHLTGGIPIGAFRDNQATLGIGTSGFAAIRLGTSPLYAGLSASAFAHSREADRTLYDRNPGTAWRANIATTNTIVQSHLLFRLQPPKQGPIEPYVEALLGGKFLFTITTVDGEYRRSTNDAYDRGTVNTHDFALSGGLGIGMDIPVYRRPATAILHALNLHLGMRYLAGQRAKYLTGSALHGTSPDQRLDNENLDVRRSNTTILQPRLGITATF